MKLKVSCPCCCEEDCETGTCRITEDIWMNLNLGGDLTFHFGITCTKCLCTFHVLIENGKWMLDGHAACPLWKKRKS